uniref:hypothetical protein n=1 Tax=Sandaracinus sp. TaxID=2024858 RepID=UPI0019D41F8B|nr:hypothetical protein [Sandaracinus sp.]QRN75743.1 Hypothetical protein MSR10575_88300 [Sandaracinus sp.]
MARGALYFPPRLDEFGNDVGEVVAMTNTTENGVAWNDGCSGFTGNVGTTLSGLSSGASYMFENYAGVDCSRGGRIYCFGIDRSTSVAPPTLAPGLRRSFQRFWTPGGGIQAADAACQSDAESAGLSGNFRALLATDGASPLSRFDLTRGAWARVDNAIVLPTAAEWATAEYFDTAPNVDATGSFHFGNYVHWIGSASPAAAGTSASTCNNWMDSTLTATAGLAGTTRVAFFSRSENRACGLTFTLITCLEE